jgi:putative membrane protein
LIVSDSNNGLKSFLQRWLINTLAVLVATYFVSGITYNKPVDLIVATLILGILNAFVRPMLMLLSLPLLIFTLGLFTLVINAALLLIVSTLMGMAHFHVDGFWTAIKGALVIAIVSIILNTLTGTGNSQVKVRRQQPPPPPPPRNDGDGPVIDV